MKEQMIEHGIGFIVCITNYRISNVKEEGRIS